MRACGLSLVLSLCAAALFGSAAVAVDIPNPLADAKAGEWVLMEDVSGSESGEAVKVTLAAIDGESFTIRREHIDADGAVVETKEHTIPLAGYREGAERMKAGAKEITEESVFVGGKEIPVVAVHYVSETKDGNGNPREFKVWISDEIPVTGIAKTWSSDVEFPSAEVVDFGF